MGHKAMPVGPGAWAWAYLWAPALRSILLCIANGVDTEGARSYVHWCAEHPLPADPDATVTDWTKLDMTATPGFLPTVAMNDTFGAKGFVPFGRQISAFVDKICTTQQTFGRTDTRRCLGCGTRVGNATGLHSATGSLRTIALLGMVNVT